jgi:hypothetical protein
MVPMTRGLGVTMQCPVDAGGAMPIWDEGCDENIEVQITGANVSRAFRYIEKDDTGKESIEVITMILETLAEPQGYVLQLGSNRFELPAVVAKRSLLTSQPALNYHSHSVAEGTKRRYFFVGETSPHWTGVDEEYYLSYVELIEKWSETTPLFSLAFYWAHSGTLESRMIHKAQKVWKAPEWYKGKVTDEDEIARIKLASPNMAFPKGNEDVIGKSAVVTGNFTAGSRGSAEESDGEEKASSSEGAGGIVGEGPRSRYPAVAQKTKGRSRSRSKSRGRAQV